MVDGYIPEPGTASEKHTPRNGTHAAFLREFKTGMPAHLILGRVGIDYATYLRYSKQVGPELRALRMKAMPEWNIRAEEKERRRLAFTENQYLESGDFFNGNG